MKMRRYVRFDNEENLDVVPVMIRTDADTLLPGTQIEVEVGARWATEHGVKVRVDGQWVACEVVEDGTDLVVKMVHEANAEEKIG